MAAWEDVAGHIHLDLVFMGIGDGLLHFVHRKIARKISQTEILAGHIDGIRTKVDGDLEFFEIAGRRQQLRFWARLGFHRATLKGIRQIFKLKLSCLQHRLS